ncbi:radical SAM protein [Lactonifactor longoviformis]|uniref:radical SAM protein n=1 Tax=Lactonifactor longoviformis TaxID=341220 RepID=UPI0036F31FA1
MKSFTFSTARGNTYVYNDKNGFIFPAGQVRDYHACPAPEKKPEALPGQVQDYLLTKGYYQLILETTQRCNLRCRYCYYGDYYKSTRNHSSDSMKFSTARKVLDDYMTHYRTIRNKNPFRKANISFQGGEPLINYGLLKETVNYCSQIYGDCEVNYTVTTNGVLLYDDILDYLTDHNFGIIVSLDGDKPGHDRNRIREDGSGSFDQAFQAIERLRKRHPGYHRLGISVRLDYLSDLDALDAFVTENKLFVTDLSMVSPGETDYYRQFSPEDKLRFYRQLSRLREQYFQAAKEGSVLLHRCSLLLPLFSSGYEMFACHPVMQEMRPSFFPYTGSCIPGEKIFASVDGTYHMCEKISSHFPIGDAEHGLDYRKIAGYINQFNSFAGRCSDCRITRFCSLCMAQAADHTALSLPSAYCRDKKACVKDTLTLYTECLEESPCAFDRFTREYLEERSRITGSLPY